MDIKETDSDYSDDDIYELVNKSDISSDGSFEFVGSEESYDRITDFDENLAETHRTVAEPSGSGTDMLDMEHENTDDADVSTRRNGEDVDMITDVLDMEHDNTDDADDSTRRNGEDVVMVTEESHDRTTDFEENRHAEIETQRNMAESSGSGTDFSEEEDQNTDDSTRGYEEYFNLLINDPPSYPRRQGNAAYFQTPEDPLMLECPANCKRREEMELKDVIREHALRFLPAKSICRFRAVSREWDKKISCPVFPIHQSTSFRSTSGYFNKDTYFPSFMPLRGAAYGVPSPTLNFLPESVSIRSSSNGLLLCQGQSSKYYVCNPATCKFQVLPLPEFYHEEPSRAVIAFEPADDRYFETSYFVICPFTLPEVDVTYFEIYSSVTRTWRSWDADCIMLLGSELKDNGFYANGTSYWETYDGSLLVFDMKKELCSVESYPFGKVPGGTLSFFDGELCYITAYVDSGYTCMIKIVRAVDMSFKRGINVRIPFVLRGERGECRVLPCVNDDDWLCCIFGTGMFTCCLKNGFVRLIRKSGIESDNEFVPYVNSLVPLEERK